MKKTLVFTFIILNYCIVFAEGINQSEALSVAKNFMLEKEVIDIKFWGDKKDEGIYIINFSPEGWCLVSSNRRARPVIGYSKSGYFDKAKLSINTYNWLVNQQEQIRESQNKSRWNDEWEILKDGPLIISKSADFVEPMLKTTWNQNSGWNRFCPEFSGGPSGKAYVGCVAVAMAQALHNIKYPARPTGAKSYTLDNYGTVAIDYDAEPAYQWNLMSYNESDDYNAQLLYNCAVAVEMNFSSDGSGAYTYRVPNALQNYFSFSPSVKNYNRFSDEDEWISLLKNDLRAGNVIIYAGNADDGKSGHAFNIDGYASNGYFHFNWGWSGSMNAYFSINNVAPGSSDFTKNQSAVVGISTPYWGPTDISLSNNSINKDAPIGSVVGEITVTDYSETDEFTFEVFGAPLFMKDGYAPSKFYIEDFKLKSKEVFSNNNSYEIATIIVTDSENNSFKKSFEINLNTTADLNNHLENEKVLFYPNPANKHIYINKNATFKYYKIYALNGTLIQKGQINSNKISLELDKQAYLIELIGDQQREVSKLLVQ